MWWIYFDTGHERAAHRVSHASDPGRQARVAYTYIHLLIVAGIVVGAAGTLLGFGSYGAFRAWPAYKYTVEHSVYVHRDHRGRGVGSRLLQEILARAVQQGVHVLVGGIDASNEGSITLHVKSGFEHAGTIRQAGFKFGRWLDLAFYQRILETPADPVDG